MHKTQDGKIANYASLALLRARALGRVTSRSPPVLAHHISCEVASLLLALRLAARALALGAGIRRLPLGRARAVCAAVGARHLLLHLHGHLVLLGLGRHLR